MGVRRAWAERVRNLLKTAGGKFARTFIVGRVCDIDLLPKSPTVAELSGRAPADNRGGEAKVCLYRP